MKSPLQQHTKLNMFCMGTWKFKVVKGVTSYPGKLQYIKKITAWHLEYTSPWLTFNFFLTAILHLGWQTAEL